MHSQFNVNLINLVSRRELNKNWFECYVENINSVIMLGSKHDQIQTELLDQQSNIIITELYKTKTLLTNEHKYETEFPEYPIWHINGKHKSKAQTCPLYCHYEIMMHVLSLKFESISEQIMALTSNEFQKAAIQNQTIETTIDKSREELLKIIEMQNKKLNIKNLQIKSLKECIEYSKEQLSETNNEKRTLENRLDDMMNKMDKVLESNARLESDVKELTHKVDHQTSVLRNVSVGINNLHGKTIDNSITNSIHELIIMTKGSKRNNYVKFVNICRQTTSNPETEIQKYIDDRYKIIYRNSVPNGMSVYKRIFENSENILRYGITKIDGSQRQYQTTLDKGKLLLRNINSLIESYLETPTNDIKEIIRSEIRDNLEPLKTEINVIKEEIRQLPERIRNYNIDYDLYYSLENKLVKASNGRYYNVNRDDDGILYIVLPKNKREEILNSNITSIKYKNDSNTKKINEIRL